MWKPGDHVLLRNIHRGRIFSARSATVVEDRPGRIVLWMAAGTPTMRPPGRPMPTDDWELADRAWHGKGIVVAYRPGDGHSIWHFRNDDGSFRGWYANLEDPWTRTDLGFDTRDLILDVWREPGGAWEWKDEDELEQVVRDGLFTEDEAAAIRAEGERVIAHASVPTGWEDWRPPPEWPVPGLPGGWDVL